jgi:hypothetical protein
MSLSMTPGNMFGFVNGMFSTVSFIIALVLLLIGILIFIMGFWWFKQKRLIENMPTSKIRSLAMGLVEIVGQVIPIGSSLLKSPHTNTDCVYYHYLVERYEQHYNASTKQTESRWVTVKNISERIRFYLKDDTAAVMVEPAGASIEIGTDFETRVGDMRYKEQYIKPDETLYIMGTAGEKSGMTEASAAHEENIMIQKGKEDKKYLITDKSEKELLKSLKVRSLVAFIIGAVMIVIAIALLIV